jgi:plastocyanin
VFTNSAGSDTTDTATLTVRTVPVVTTDPADHTVTAGDPVTFSAAATGSPAPTVQWQRSTDGTAWTDLPGQNSGTLTFTTTAAQDGNRYRAVFTNPAGSDTTTAATLTVTSPPVVVEQPRDQTTRPGEPVTFTVDVTGSPAPTVQWQVSTDRGVSWSAIDGATSPTLAFVPTRADDGNRYRARLTNSLGTTYSDPVTLTVTAAPPVTPTPPMTPPVTPPATPTPGPSGTAKPSPLAVTGQHLAGMGAAALLLLLTGTALTVLARRRRRS